MHRSFASLKMTTRAYVANSRHDTGDCSQAVVLNLWSRADSPATMTRGTQVGHVRKFTSDPESVLPLRRPELRSAKRRERPLVGNVELVWRLRGAGDASGEGGRKDSVSQYWFQLTA